MNTQDTIKKTGGFIRNSATFKIISVGILVLILLIPISLTGSLMREREHRRNMVVKEINEKWGNAQTITGPFSLFLTNLTSKTKTTGRKLILNISTSCQNH